MLEGLIVALVVVSVVASLGFGIVWLLPLFFTDKISRAENKFWKDVLGFNPNARKRRRR